MSTSIQTLKTAIVTKLNGVSGLHKVYNYEPDKPEDGKYPYATVTIENGEGKFGDTVRNIRDIRCQINVYQERVEISAGNQKAERISDEIIDEILTAFDADTQLSGSALMVKPLSFNTDYIEGTIGDTRVAQFIVDAKVVVPSS